MPLNEEVLGGDLYFKVSTDGGTTKNLMGVARGASISMVFPNVDVSSKSTQGYVKRKATHGKSATITHNGLVRFEDQAGEVQFGDVFTLADDGTEVDWYFEPNTPGSGDVTISGKGLFNQLEGQADNASEATCSITLDSSGPFSKIVGA